ncbi:histidine--tRNA ligase, cytoplasmic-like [Rutidosis leptorrhynchoides]|uniref:histidine--tRNA ligase, cytoplasmic-like n=1 Tax=Rutidosis leptorrhynchoides TaxID=125765 RepID=UPI003A993A02
MKIKEDNRDEEDERSCWQDGKNLCSHWYDLIVPFARYVSMNGLDSIQNGFKSFRAYQMATVFRDCRESYQCQFDIAGDESVAVAEYEVVYIMSELLDDLNIGGCEKVVEWSVGYLWRAVSLSQVSNVCSTIDKLDKLSLEQIKKELIDVKGIDVKTVSNICSFLRTFRGKPREFLSKLKEEHNELLINESSKQAWNEFDKLFDMLEDTGRIKNFVLDLSLSLSRCPDYYTGVIYEAVLKGVTTQQQQVGLIAYGGRYDNLIGMFGSEPVPAIGVTLEIEHVQSWNNTIKMS